jgi:hypothetical protein
VRRSHQANYSKNANDDYDTFFSNKISEGDKQL